MALPCQASGKGKSTTTPWTKDSTEMAYTRHMEMERRDAKDRTSTGIINIASEDWKTAGLDERSWKEEGEKNI